MVGQRHPLPALPTGVLPIFNGDGIMCPKKHLDQFVNISKIHSIINDDVMVRLFLQTLVCLAYDCYLSLPDHSISSFDDMEDAFLFLYFEHVPYYTLFTYFTQIHLEKNEKLQDFNLRFHKTLTWILENMRPNDPIILGCYKNAMPTNVKYGIKTANIDTLEEAMDKVFEMEDNML